VKGEPRTPDAGNGQRTAAYPARPFSSYRGRHDRQAFASAEQKYARYSALAREACSRGDMVAMENFYQHAEHYFRVMRAAGERDE
jgi:Domain of unknown function (DUF4167)